MRALWEPLYAAGADVILNGHQHNYERFDPQNPGGRLDPNGIRQITVGTGGASLGGFGEVQPNSVVRNDKTHGVLKLTLRDGSYDWQFLPIAGQTFADVGTGICVGPAPPSKGSVVYASDGFGRTVADTWGSADVGGGYRLTGSNGDYDVTGGKGTMRLVAGANRNALLTVSARDVDAAVRVSSDKPPSGGTGQLASLLLRRIEATANTVQHQYRARLRLAPGGAVYVAAAKLVGSSETLLAPEVRVPDVSFDPGTTVVALRAQVEGADPTTMRVKAWAVGSVEPAGWLVTASDATPALQAAGGIGLRGLLAGAASNAPVTLGFDDLHAIGAALR